MNALHLALMSAIIWAQQTNTHQRKDYTMKKLTYHHTALSRGYIRIGETRTESYSGRFGTGLKIYKHNPSSSRYCIVEYWTKED